jgi:hypothetical protein
LLRGLCALKRSVFVCAAVIFNVCDLSQTGYLHRGEYRARSLKNLAQIASFGCTGELRRMIRSLLISAHKLSDEDDTVSRKRI